MTEQHWDNPDLGPHGHRDGQDDDNYSLDDLTLFPKARTSAKSILEMHQLSDVDSSPFAHHHTLGSRRNQSAPGNHIHDGKSSPLIPSLSNWTQYIDNSNAASNWFGSGVNPAINNGTIAAKYALYGKLCFVRLTLIFGSTTTQGTGFWSFNYPFAASATDSTFSGSVSTYAGGFWVGGVYHNASRFSFSNNGNASFWGPGNPGTFGTGNAIVSSFFYELA